jgi:monovalent cation:H+ antiporter-2, CPA2 family
VAQFAIVVTGLSMMVTPLCAGCGQWLGQVLQRNETREHMPQEVGSKPTDHVVIGGFGRVGQTLARLLDTERVPYVALDTNAGLVAEKRKDNPNVYLGDAGRGELLGLVGADRARMFVVTVNEPKAAERMVAAARKINPDAPVFARAADPAHAIRLLRLGAVDVIPEAVEASLELGERVLEALGVPADAAERRVDAVRAEELGRLTAELNKP